MVINISLNKLFNDYEEAFNVLDFKRMGEFFADNFISAGLNGTIANSKAEYLKLSQQASEFYKSIGQKTAKMISLYETPISNEYSLVKVNWAVTFQKTGDKPIEFDVSYVVQKIGDPKIILFITHQNELKAMKDLGLK